MKFTKLSIAVAGIAVAATVTVLNVQAQCCGGCKETKKVEKTNFYKKTGALDVAKVKKAYFSLMKKYNTPIYDVMKTDNFWVCDFLQGEFTQLGMGGIFWMNLKGTYEGCKDESFNGKKWGFLGHEIFLLPGQALPEHRHFAGPEGFGAKMEGWFIRYGSARFFSETNTNQGEKLISSLPKAEQPWGFGEDWFKCKYYVDKKQGETWQLAAPEKYHFMQALSEGTITSEFATYHNDVRFSKPGMAFDNTKAKNAK